MRIVKLLFFALTAPADLLVSAINNKYHLPLRERVAWNHRCLKRLQNIFSIRISLHQSSEQLGTLVNSPLLVCNHLGYLDPIVTGVLAPSVHVAKKEVAKWPLVGMFISMGGTLFIDRSQKRETRRLADSISACTRESVPVWVFLEGTTSDGQGVLPFHSSLLDPAVQNGWPVVPVAVLYSVPAGYESVHVPWWGDQSMLLHMWRLLALPYVEARVCIGTPEIDGTDRKTLAKRLHGRVCDLRKNLLPAQPYSV